MKNTRRTLQTKQTARRNMSNIWKSTLLGKESDTNDREPTRIRDLTSRRHVNNVLIWRTLSLTAWFVVILLCGTSSQANAQLTSNVFLRVRMIRPSGSPSFATGFTLEVDGRQYLITAKHVVTGMAAEDAIEIRKGDQWSQVKVKVLRCDDPIDIAVLVPPKQLTVDFPLESTMDGIRYAQDVYFAGFPYGLSTSGAQNLTGGYPI